MLLQAKLLNILAVFVFVFAQVFTICLTIY